MKQYLAIKAKHPDAILLFRVGDFYETFSEDAVKTSKILDIVLTKRANGSASHIELAGFPYHALDTYLPKLVKAGERVAICDQLEDPKQTKKIVKRGVTELVTPGVSYNDNVLQKKANNFLAGVFFNKHIIGVSFLDVSTGEFLIAEGEKEYVDKLLQTFMPGEVLYQKQQGTQFFESFGEECYSYALEDWVFTKQFASDLLLGHFNTNSLKGFGVQELENGVIAAGALMHYLLETQHDKISHITSLKKIDKENCLWMDRFTIKNLELLYPLNEGGGTLLDILDYTETALGARLIKRWIVFPLKNKKEIDDRLNLVQQFVNNHAFKDEAKLLIKNIGDLERLASKISIKRISPREIMHLKNSLEVIRPLQSLCKKIKNKGLSFLLNDLDDCKTLIKTIEKTIQHEAPAQLNKPNTIKDGVSKELDYLRTVAYSGKDFLVKIQQREMEKTGIPSLKIAFNNVFGYYLEVRNAHKDKVPEDWIRKQTLVNAERYITEELKEYEAKILGAEEKILKIEMKLYDQLLNQALKYIKAIQQNAVIIAQLDCVISFAHVSYMNGYVKPIIDNNKIINIKNGRHPVIEQQLPAEESYIANDTYLDDKQQQVMMITGPNMSGKSALLRQTALIVLLAQMGCYVPADYVSIGVVDRVFTRVGASDNISSGESTFMVEMNEAASILNNISDRSLILLDEIGRGTSTYDGISIAWAITEYIHEYALRAKTMFATHYHELNEMSKSFDRIKNYNISIKETSEKIIFIRKLIKGGSEHSFGIHVAKMAGMPSKVIAKANLILKKLEKSHSNEELVANIESVQDNFQLSFFKLDDPVLEQIKEEIIKTDINSLTPVEALLKLNEIKKLIGG